MGKASRVCGKPGCPAITQSRYCEPHWAEHEAKRGTPTQRGYGKDYQAERRQWVKRVATGIVRCWRCKALIQAGEPFDLGHSDDRTRINGPEHQLCNRSAAGKASHEPPPF